MKHLFANGAYGRLTLMDEAAYLNFVIEIIRRSEQQKAYWSFHVEGSSSVPSDG